MKAAATTMKKMKKWPEKQEETHRGGGPGARVGSPGRKLEGLRGVMCPVSARAWFTPGTKGSSSPARRGGGPGGTWDPAPPTAVNWSRALSSTDTTPGSSECHVPHGLGSRKEEKQE